MRSDLGAGSIARSAPVRVAGEVVAALAFLTRLPVATTSATIGAAAFGLVGAIIGAIGTLPLVLLGGAAPLAAAALAVGAMALVSGALHLDGLGDTADAMAAATPEHAERARVDPRLGTAGVAAVGIVLILDVTLLGALVERLGPLGAALACVTAASASRAIAVATAWTQRRRTRQGGGAWLASQLTVVAVVVTIATAILVGLASAAVDAAPAIAVGALAGSLAGLAAAAGLVRLRDGLDGDLLGASVELTFAAVLLAIVLLA